MTTDLAYDPVSAIGEAKLLERPPSCLPRTRRAGDPLCPGGAAPSATIMSRRYAAGISQFTPLMVSSSLKVGMIRLRGSVAAHNPGRVPAARRTGDQCGNPDRPGCSKSRAVPVGWRRRVCSCCSRGGKKGRDAAGQSAPVGGEIHQRPRPPAGGPGAVILALEAEPGFGSRSARSARRATYRTVTIRSFLLKIRHRRKLGRSTYRGRCRTRRKRFELIGAREGRRRRRRLSGSAGPFAQPSSACQTCRPAALPELRFPLRWRVRSEVDLT
jgi:hypothetical protein